MIRDVGYTRAKYGFDAETCGVICAINRQSPDIAMGVDTGGAGDQGLMFGFACDETPELMPMPIQLAHSLTHKLAEVRKQGVVDFLRPDGKSQVTIEYVDGRPVRVDTVVISTQHSDKVSAGDLQDAVLNEVIKPVLPAAMVDKNTKYHINPTGRFVTGGPMGDAASPAAKSSWTPTAVTAATAAARFLEKIQRRWTARRAIWRATWRRISSRRAWRPRWKCKSLTRSASRSPFR